MSMSSKLRWDSVNLDKFGDIEIDSPLPILNYIKRSQLALEIAKDNQR
jgi:hypothetical protein